MKLWDLNPPSDWFKKLFTSDQQSLFFPNERMVTLSFEHLSCHLPEGNHFLIRVFPVAQHHARYIIHSHLVELIFVTIGGFQIQQWILFTEQLWVLLSLLWLVPKLGWVLFHGCVTCAIGSWMNHQQVFTKGVTWSGLSSKMICLAIEEATGETGRGGAWDGGRGLSGLGLEPGKREPRAPARPQE